MVLGRGEKLERGRLQGVWQALQQQQSTRLAAGVVEPTAAVEPAAEDRHLRLAPARSKSTTRNRRRSFPRASQAERLLVSGS